MAEMNLMAELRRAKLERLSANWATPPPSHLTPSLAPRMEIRRSDQAVVVAPKAKEKVAKGIAIGGSSNGGLLKDPKVSSDPKMSPDIEMILDPKGGQVRKLLRVQKKIFRR
ncbi:hypothetical protein SESBI_32402 [Sesbania bispinosa]|nr:hypothetical protein SESBI_32402 [Sesbania bispinosa]